MPKTRAARFWPRLRRGESVALISDAGTPLVSDPGFKLVRAVIEAGHRVFPIPGASALLAGLVASGLPTDRFLFAGFLPAKAGRAPRRARRAGGRRATLIFYESGPRLAESLADMADMLGPRPAAVARELTKMFEETRRDTLDALAAHYAEAGAPKGEIVVIVGPPPGSAGSERRGARCVSRRCADARRREGSRQRSRARHSACRASALMRARCELKDRA